MVDANIKKNYCELRSTCVNSKISNITKGSFIITSFADFASIHLLVLKGRPESEELEYKGVPVKHFFNGLF